MLWGHKAALCPSLPDALVADRHPQWWTQPPAGSGDGGRSAHPARQRWHFPNPQQEKEWRGTDAPHAGQANTYRPRRGRSVKYRTWNRIAEVRFISEGCFQRYEASMSHGGIHSRAAASPS